MNGAWLVVIVYASVLILCGWAVNYERFGRVWQKIKAGIMIMDVCGWLCYIGSCFSLAVVALIAWWSREDFLFQFRSWLRRTENRLARAAGPTRAERRAADLKRKIDWLEHISDQWHELRMAGRTPMWTDVFGWIDDVSVCPCGYVRECAIWCGDGSCHGTHADQPVSDQLSSWTHTSIGVTTRQAAESMTALARMIATRDGS